MSAAAWRGVARAWRSLGPLAPLLTFLALGLAALSAARFGLVIWQAPRLAADTSLAALLLTGLRMDALLLCYLLVVPALVWLLWPPGRRADRVFVACLAALGAFVAFMEAATPAFFAEYDLRPDRVFFEYLDHPREVWSMLVAGHLAALVAAPLAAAAFARALWRALQDAVGVDAGWSWRRRAMLAPFVLLVLGLGARSSLDHRPANISTANFSDDRIADQLALNSAYTLLYALAGAREEADPAASYGELGWDETLARVRRHTDLPAAAFTDAALPTLHRQAAPPVPRPRNLVVILQESVGAGFVGHLGGLPLTPNLDRLAAEGLWFTQLHATGTRTARGMEAVIAGFPPTPAPAVLKLPRAQHDFFTLAELLRRQGYATSFIYGGGANFDNMGAFFAGNGFARIVEQRDFAAPSFVASWGVSDEDLLLRANEEFKAARGPFFAFVMTSSNHDPFEIPAGAIEPYNAPLHTRENAIKYADHALGRFFAAARREPYFADTVFLVAADHDARVFGGEVLPLAHFRIPGVIVGPGVPRRRHDGLASQIDLAPTLLHLLGISSEHPMIGRDLLNPAAGGEGRALMQYGTSLGLQVGARVAVLQPERPAETFAAVGGRLIAAPHDPELERDALAHVLWAARSYERGLYRLPARGAR